MEENTTNDAPVQPEVATEQSAETVVVAEVKAEKPRFQRRKNGRNSRATTSQNKAGANQLSCGEISDISSESEKLSGSNINGYASDKKQYKKSEDAQAQNAEQENSETPQEKSEEDRKDENEHSGPAFEQKKFTPRTIEVSLEDRRPKNVDSKKIDDVVSYSSADEANCPSVSLFARIKAALKSIFGSKKSKKNNKGKHFDKNGKKDFKGKKKFHKNFKDGGKNFNRRHQNRGNRRPQGGGNNKPQQ